MLIVGLIIILLVSSCSITILCSYCRFKKKEREESLSNTKTAKDSKNASETERRMRDFDLSVSSSMTEEKHHIDDEEQGTS